MKSKKSNNQEDTMTETASQTAENTETAAAAKDKMSDETAAATDNMSEPSLEEQIAAWHDKYLRLQAEFDNFRKRTLREKMELVERGGEEVLKAVLSVMDDMQRAVEASHKSDDIEALREGESLVVKKFADMLARFDVHEIECLDTEFDADRQEAVARFAAGEDKSGRVIDVVQRGYMRGDKVLRYAKVVVGE
ncbi:MAG: nucleotide exchange factor GrpE [Alistipes sp.]|nr:nucleotide exchange factor GrpE [Alistipes sp.]